MKYRNRRRRRRRRKDEEEEEVLTDWLCKKRQGVHIPLSPPVLYLRYILLTMPHVAHCLLSKLDIDSLQVFATCCPSLRPSIIQWLQSIVERNNNGEVLLGIFTRFPILHGNYSQKEYKMILKRVQEPYHESLHNGLVTHIISAVTYYIACIVTVGRPSNFEIDGWKADEPGKMRIVDNNLRDLRLKCRTFYRFRQFLKRNCKNVYNSMTNDLPKHCTSITLQVTIPPTSMKYRAADHYFNMVIHLLDEEIATPELYNYLEEKLREEYSAAAADTEPTLTHPKVEVFLLTPCSPGWWRAEGKTIVGHSCSSSSS